jgi:hypothetical protein
MKVLFSPLVQSCFQEMEEILYKKEYFGFEDCAIQHVRELHLRLETPSHSARKTCSKILQQIWEKFVLLPLPKKQSNAVVCIFHHILCPRGGCLSGAMLEQ